MQKVIADTNFLLSQFEYAVDVPTELQRIIIGPLTLVICSGTMSELSSIAGRTGKRASAARFVLQNLPRLRARFPVEEVPSEGKVDDWIIKYSQANSMTVATNDIPLRKRLLALKVPVIAMKGKSKLDFV